MPFNYNSVQIAGSLTRDPQVKFLANERAVAEFGLAINRRFKGADGQMKEDTTFVDVEAWGRTAELVGQYLTKGSPCFIEGRLRLETWEDKKDGSKRSKLKVVADSVQFLGTKGDRERHEAETGGAVDHDGAAPQTGRRMPMPGEQAPIAAMPAMDDADPPF